MQPLTPHGKDQHKDMQHESAMGEKTIRLRSKQQEDTQGQHFNLPQNGHSQLVKD